MDAIRLKNILANQVQQICSKLGFTARMQGLMPENQLMSYINRVKTKNYTVISMNAEKAFDKIKYPFCNKITQGVSST